MDGWLLSNLAVAVAAGNFACNMLSNWCMRFLWECHRRSEAFSKGTKITTFVVAPAFLPCLKLRQSHNGPDVPSGFAPFQNAQKALQYSGIRPCNFESQRKPWPSGYWRVLSAAYPTKTPGRGGKVISDPTKCPVSSGLCLKMLICDSVECQVEGAGLKRSFIFPFFSTSNCNLSLI